MSTNNWVVTPDFVRPTAITAATEDAANGYGAANLLDPPGSLEASRRPFIVYRGTNLTAPAIIFDFGAPVTIARVVLNNANFSVATWAAGSNGIAFGTALGTFQCPFDDNLADDRRKCWQAINMGSALRYLRLTPSSFTAGATYPELGAAMFLVSASIAPLTFNVGFPSGLADQGLTEEVLPGLRRERNIEGAIHFVRTMQQANWNRGAGDVHFKKIKKWLAVGRTTPYLIYESRGEDGQGTSPYVYLTLLDNQPSVRELSVKHFTTDAIIARECVA